VAEALARVVTLLRAGETVLVFAEGERGRRPRIDAGAQTHGVGRILGAVPDCRLLCVHLRADTQAGFSDLPPRGDRCRVEFALVEPRSRAWGLRRSLDLTRQVLATLVELEARHFAARGEEPTGPVPLGDAGGEAATPLHR
jgi:hypothetical protein